MSLAVILCVLAPATALRGSGQKTELLTDMRPEVVSKLLSEVTDQWVMDFVNVMTNKTGEPYAYSKMEKSCLTVTKSIVDGSDGDEDRVSEYMQDVCSRSSSNMCAGFAKSIDVAMIGDSNFNRNSLKLANFCKGFWTTDVQGAANKKKEQMDADEKAAAEKKAADEKAAAEKKEADEKAAAEKKAADEKAAEEAAAKAAADKKAADEQAAADAAKASDEQRAQAEKLRGSIRAKMENLTASIEKTSASVEKTYNSTEDDVQKLVEHAQKAMMLASKKEAEEVQKAKEAKEAAEKEAAEKKAQEAAAAAAAQQKNTTNATAANDSMPVEVTDMMNVNISKAEEAAVAEGDAKADAIIEKATEKVQKNVTQKA